MTIFDEASDKAKAATDAVSAKLDELERAADKMGADLASDSAFQVKLGVGLIFGGFALVGIGIWGESKTTNSGT